MAVIIVMSKHENGEVTQFNYGKPQNISLKAIERFEQLHSAKPILYQTGMSALDVQKLLNAKLAELQQGSAVRYTTERMPADDKQITATCRISHGALPPRYR